MLYSSLMFSKDRRLSMRCYRGFAKIFFNVFFFFSSSSEKEALERPGLQGNPTHIRVTKEEGEPGFSSSSEVRSFSLKYYASSFCPPAVGGPAAQSQLRGSIIIVFDPVSTSCSQVFTIDTAGSVAEIRKHRFCIFLLPPRKIETRVVPGEVETRVSKGGTD